VASDDTYHKVAQTKYSGMAWTEATNRRLLSWGFNTLSTGSYLGSMPIATDVSFPVDSKGLRSQAVKMPFILEIRPALYSMTNPIISSGGSNRRLLNQPVKNMIYGHSPYYREYVPSGGIADYYDSGIEEWLRADLRSDIWATIRDSPYLNYLVGFSGDDGDEMYGFT